MTFGPGSPIRVIGHRGAAGVAPENTLPSLRHAAAAGAHAVEFDLRCTADDRLVLLHDAIVDRTTDGTGPIEGMSLEEAAGLDAGYRFTTDGGRSFPYRGRGIAIPTLEEAIAEIAPLPMILELKSQRAGEVLPGFLEQHRLAGPAIVGSFSRSAAEAVAPQVRSRCASEEELRAYVLLGKIGLARVAVPQAEAVMVPERRFLRVVTRRFVRGAHAHGLGVFVWTVNRPDDMRRLWDWGIDGVITDEPGRALRVLRERLAAGVER